MNSVAFPVLDPYFRSQFPVVSNFKIHLEIVALYTLFLKCFSVYSFSFFQMKLIKLNNCSFKRFFTIAVHDESKKPIATFYEFFIQNYTSTNIFLQWLMHFLSCCGLVQLGFLLFAQSRSKLTLIEADGSVN